MFSLQLVNNAVAQLHKLRNGGVCMFFQGLLTSIILLLVGTLWGVYFQVRSFGVSRMVAVLIGWMIPLLAIRLIFRVLQANREDNVSASQKARFAISVFPISINLLCSAVADTYESIVPSRGSVKEQYKTLRNKRKVISLNAEKSVEQNYLYAY